MALAPQQQESTTNWNWGGCFEVWAIGAFFALLAALLALAYGIPYAFLNALTDWSVVTTLLVITSFYANILVLGVGLEKRYAKRKP